MAQSGESGHSVWVLQTGTLSNDPTTEKKRASLFEFSPDEHPLVTNSGGGYASNFPILQSDKSKRDLVTACAVRRNTAEITDSSGDSLNV